MRAPALLRGGVIALVLALTAPAFAADVSSDLDIVAETVDQLLRRSKVLEEQLRPGATYINEAAAIQRFQDNVYLYMVGEYPLAAEGFFTLVTAGALGDAGLHRDAEWYLADSLYAMNNFDTAELRFKVLVEDGQHPFRDDAVRRLLELYAKQARTDDFYALYESEVLRGRVQATDVVVYSVGKAFFAQGEYTQARVELSKVISESPWYGKSQYILGAIDVAEERLDDSIALFERASNASIETVEDQQVHDLAQLAMGRVNFELGDYEKSVEAYQRVSGESEYNDARLFELVWTYIKLEEWIEALRAAELFLITFPQHENTAEIRLLQGHLHMAQVHYDDALIEYENVVQEYGPVKEQFGALANAADNSTQLREIRDLSAGGTSSELPAFAVAMMLADPDLSRAIGVFGELAKQQSDIEISESLIRELRGVLASDQGIGGFEEMRYDAVLASNQAAEQALMLLEIEEEWLLDNLPVNQRGRVSPLRARRLALIGAARDSAFQVEAAREALERHKMGVRRVRRDTASVIDLAAEHQKEIDTLRGSLDDPKLNLDQITREAVLEDLVFLEKELRVARSGLDVLDIELSRLKSPEESKAIVHNTAPVGELLAEIEKLRHDYSDVRPGNRLVETSERVDSLHHSLTAVHLRLAKVMNGLEDVERSELEHLRARFEKEVQEVASQRVAMERTLKDAEIVSLELTRDGFGRLEDFFAESVLKADMGIIDVYWAQKLATIDEIDRIKAEKEQLLTELQRRFALIRDKMGK